MRFGLRGPDLSDFNHNHLAVEEDRYISSKALPKIIEETPDQPRAKDSSVLTESPSEKTKKSNFMIFNFL
jgi:hypothetical protein